MWSAFGKFCAVVIVAFAALTALSPERRRTLIAWFQDCPMVVCSPSASGDGPQRAARPEPAPIPDSQTPSHGSRGGSPGGAQAPCSQCSSSGPAQQTFTVAARSPSAPGGLAPEPPPPPLPEQPPADNANGYVSIPGCWGLEGETAAAEPDLADDWLEPYSFEIDFSIEGFWDPRRGDRARRAHFWHAERHAGKEPEHRERELLVTHDALGPRLEPAQIPPADEQKKRTDVEPVRLAQRDAHQPDREKEKEQEKDREQEARQGEGVPAQPGPADAPPPVSFGALSPAGPLWPSPPLVFRQLPPSISPAMGMPSSWGGAAPQSGYAASALSYHFSEPLGYAHGAPAEPPHYHSEASGHGQATPAPYHNSEPPSYNHSASVPQYDHYQSSGSSHSTSESYHHAEASSSDRDERKKKD